MWIESHQELAQHPKTRKLARRLEISIPQAIGHLHCLWHWALTHAFDGDLSGYDVEDIAVGALWDGEAKEFVDALVDAKGRSGSGFLDRTKTSLLLHDWVTYTAHLRARRESAQKANHSRWHLGRGISDPSCALCSTPENVRSESERSPNASERSPNGHDSESTVPNLTRPNPTEPRTKPTSSSAIADFEEFWKNYPTRPNTSSKGVKKVALTAWKKLSPEKRRAALAALPIYAQAKNGYPKDAERYLRGEEWDGLDNVVSLPESEYQWL